MNWSEMQASWEDMSVVIQAHWPKLTDDELDNIKGDRSELVRAIVLHYGFRVHRHAAFDGGVFGRSRV